MKLTSLAVIALTAMALPLPLAAQDATMSAATVKGATVTVTGRGRVGVTPDMATLSVGVVSQGDTAAAALAANSKQVAALLEQIRAEGIAGRDIQTSGLSLGPVYDHGSRGDGGPPQVTGYQVSNTVTLRVRALDDLGGILDRLVTTGANQLNGLSFDVADRGPLEDRARKEAVADAQRRAALLAEAAGLTLGPVLVISEGGTAQSPRPMFARAAEAEVPIEGGEVSVEASVTITFELDGR